MLVGILYLLIQIIWGIIQTFAGAVLYLINMKFKHYLYHGAVVTEWNIPTSVSLGLFIFISENCPFDKRQENRIPDDEIYNRTLVHEYGHTIQSLILGPLYIIIIGIPSMIWLSLFSSYRIKNSVSYFEFYTEDIANKLGEYVTKDKSMENAMIE